MQDYVEGQRRTSRRTGEVQEFRGGQWVTVTPGQGGGAGVGVVRLPEQPDQITPYQAAQLDLSTRAADRADAQFAAQEEERRREATGPRELSRGDASRVDARVSRAREAEGLQRDLLRFRELLDRQRTGPVTGATADMQAGFDAEIAEMRSIINRLAPNMRAEGSGATSDFEMRMYVSALPNLSNSPEANRAIIDRALEETRRAVQEAEFYERYAAENGSLLGADTAFRQSLTAGGREPGAERDDPGALDLETLARGAPQEPPGTGGGDGNLVVVNEGVRNINGRAIFTATGEDLGPFAEWERRQAEAYAPYAAEDRANLEAQIRADEDARARASATPGALRALNLGATGEFMDEIDALGAGLETRGLNAVRRLRGEEIPYTSDQAAQAVRGAERDAAEWFRDDHPIADFGLRLAGGIAMPGGRLAGGYIQGGNTAAQMGARAGQVGALYGGITGLGAGEGDVADRAPGGVMNALAGYGIGRLAQGGINALASRVPATGAAPQGRNAFLIDNGVRLSPGQAARDIPGLGPILNATEEGLGSLPIVGGMVRRQRDLGVEDMNRGLYREALNPIGGTVPQGRPGLDALADVSRQLGSAYDEVLANVSGQADDAFRAQMDDLLTQAETSTPGVRDRVGAAIRQRVLLPLDQAGGAFDGQTIKRIESQLSQIYDNALQSGDLDAPDVANLIGEARTALRGLVARAAPAQAPRIQAINQGYAPYARLREAATMAGPMGQDGIIQPANLASVVRRRSTPEQLVNRNALLQDWADAGINLRNVIPNSGTADRLAVGGAGLAAAGGGTAVAGVPAALQFGAGVAAVYSPPVQFVLNRAYRAGRSAPDLGQVASELLAIGRQNPALSSEVTRALAELRQRIGGEPRQAADPTARIELQPQSR